MYILIKETQKYIHVSVFLHLSIMAKTSHCDKDQVNVTVHLKNFETQGTDGRYCVLPWLLDSLLNEVHSINLYTSIRIQLFNMN